jgi:predicted GNAT family acetyltransferase
MAESVRDNTDEQRFELEINGQTAFTYYEMQSPGIIKFMHTDVPLVMSGKGVASRLIKGALEQVRARGLKVKAECEFVAGYLGKHPEFGDLIA